MGRAVFCWIVVILSIWGSFAYAGDTERLIVEEFLIAEGVEPSQAKSIMQDSRIAVHQDIIIKNLFYSSPKGSAKRPDVIDISNRLIEQARTFMRDHAEKLAAVEKRFGTSPRIITAILLIESRLGTYKMTYNVASAYANLAFMLDPDYLKNIQSMYVKEYPQLAEEATLNRAKRKARWAAAELAYLIHLANHLHVDPLSLSGSFAGAMGPGQFIPSSFWIFGMDANGDGTADPFNMADASFSMGHYLKQYGWREDATVEEKRKAIWYYNRSDVYVNTVMMVYERLKQGKVSDPPAGGETTPAGGETTPAGGKTIPR